MRQKMEHSLSIAEAEQPEDWDEEEDGTWEPPKVPNPKCEDPGCGEWKPKSIPNPAYKGKWTAPLIDNPDYKVRLLRYAASGCCCCGASSHLSGLVDTCLSWLNGRPTWQSHAACMVMMCVK